MELSPPAERRRFDPKAVFVQTPVQVVISVLGLVQMLFSRLPAVLMVATPYLGLLGGFAAFVKWNGGIVLGKHALDIFLFFREA